MKKGTYKQRTKEPRGSYKPRTRYAVAAWDIPNNRFAGMFENAGHAGEVLLDQKASGPDIPNIINTAQGKGKHVSVKGFLFKNIPISGKSISRELINEAEHQMEKMAAALHMSQHPELFTEEMTDNVLDKVRKNIISK